MVNVIGIRSMLTCVTPIYFATSFSFSPLRILVIPMSSVISLLTALPPLLRASWAPQVRSIALLRRGSTGDVMIFSPWTGTNYDHAARQLLNGCRLFNLIIERWSSPCPSFLRALPLDRQNKRALSEFSCLCMHA